ncbi:unnamed protein product [Rhizophagus irregularis]|uniref:F-box domain-containing protein n=1 Tax=Rhizophagus irregularis TaxID=588596 RepID=A0A2N1NQV2_9GLOM|nr:hypothetical protein RhiirC2_845367 [Rhizophagus irregularis]CAB4381478.1 unnamed protein product [Rhizophagus irregularis]CAB5332883.1 unnamed protein product [Rhizophagus irregularis]
MAATLPELCLHLIFKELEKDWKARYTCILINRHWCISAIPELWKDPFSFCFESGQKERYVQLMDSYIKCLSQEFRESVGLDSTVKAIFNYTSFLQKFWLNDILATIKVWLDTSIFFEEKVKGSTLLEKEFERKTVLKIFKALCENFIINSTYMEGIYFNEEQIMNIFELTQAEENLSNITCLDCVIVGDEVGLLPTILLSASKILMNLKKIIIIWINDITPLDLCVKNMAQLIKNQKRLEDVTISCLDSDFPIIWKSVLEHCNVLTCFCLNLIQFNKSDPFPLHELSIFSNLQQLEITYCSNFKFSINDNDLSLSFQKLNRICIIMDEGKGFPPDFIKVLFKQSNEKIKELTLSIDESETKDILSYCQDYCTKLIELTYSIDINYVNLFSSYLNTLKYLEILSLRYLEFSGEDLLILIGENLPKSVINLTFNFENYLQFNYLSKLFKICKEKGIKFKVLDFSNCSFFNDHHICLLLTYYNNGQLDKLYLGNKKNFTKKYIDDVKKHVGFVKFSEYRAKYRLPDIEYNELY